MTTRKPISRQLAVVLDAEDESFYLILDRSTERLGMGNFAFKPGDMYNCTCALDLNFGRGTVHFAVTA